MKRKYFSFPMTLVVSFVLALSMFTTALAAPVVVPDDFIESADFSVNTFSTLNNETVTFDLADFDLSQLKQLTEDANMIPLYNE